MNTQTCVLLLRYRDLLAAGIIRNRTTLDRWIKAGQFPRPLRIGPNTNAWRASDVEQWLDEREQKQIQRETLEGK